MLVSRHADAIEFAQAFRNYGKPDHEIGGLNFRMNEFTAAVGIVQTERLPEIVSWKNEALRTHIDPIHPSRLHLPDGMTSGLYKVIVFEPIEHSTGRVYDDPCHRLLGHPVDLPNTDWVAANHWCVPLTTAPRRRFSRRARRRRLSQRRVSCRSTPAPASASMSPVLNASGCGGPHWSAPARARPGRSISRPNAIGIARVAGHD
jgi:hypothetical protein